MVFEIISPVVSFFGAVIEGTHKFILPALSLAQLKQSFKGNEFYQRKRKYHLKIRQVSKFRIPHFP